MILTIVNISVRAIIIIIIIIIIVYYDYLI